MLGSSRDSLAACQERVDALRSEAGFDRLAGDLFAVASVLDRESALRTALADSGQSSQLRAALVRDLFGERIASVSSQVLEFVVDQRWSSDGDLVTAVELLADQAAFTVAEADGTLDATEEELFRFGRALESSSALQMALTDPAQSSETKAGIVRDLLAGRSTSATTQVLQHVVGHLRGRRADAAVDQLSDLAAKQRERLLAEVRVAAPIDDEQRRRLADILSRIKGRTVRLNVAVDPSVLGGVHVRIGDDVIDGTVAARMEQARRAILG